MGRIQIWIFLLAGSPLAAPVWAADPGGSPAPLPNPGAALARYVSAASQNPVWGAESVEIEASIPRLAKQGRLSAIRRGPVGAPPFGKPEYQVLAMDGDRTVRQQVIARYLSADVEAAAMPPASVAITSANYRFRYVGAVAEGGALVYAFEIMPHKKRAGLLRGRLWIDAGTGLALRLTGYLVKSPSVFVRRVSITRDTCVRDGAAYARITQVEIDTRLIGRAELTITERPYSPATGEEIGPGGPDLALRQQAEGR